MVALKKIRSLGTYAKIILILLVLMSLLFSILYPVTMSKKGFAYRGSILRPTKKEDGTVYSGVVQGTPVSFEVNNDRTVVLHAGEQIIGPYSVTEVPEAVPKGDPWESLMTGVELRCGEEIVFRGGMLRRDSGEYLLVSDGDDETDRSIINMEYGVNPIYDSDGNEINLTNPSPAAIIELMYGPRMSNKGSIAGWIGGIFICAFTAVLVIFAKDMFRLKVNLSVQNAADADPTDLTVIGWYISWTVMPLLALFVFIFGLRLSGV